MSEMLLRLADRVLNRPLMILPDKLTIVTEVLAGRIGISAIALAPAASRFVGASRQGVPYRVTEKGVAVISIVGSLVNRGAWIGAESGIISYEGLQQQVETAARDPNVKSVLLDIESPGGEAVGAFELAALVRKAGGVKPIHAIVNGMAASAAYAIASAAKSITTIQSGVVGSIGVVAMHGDYSRAIDRSGITPTLIHAGAHKVDGNPYEPLSKEVRGDLQADVDKFYEMFLGAVAAGRGARLTSKAAKETEARTFIGADAVAVGLADQVGTFADLIDSLERNPGAARATPAYSAANMGKKKMTDTERFVAFAEGALAERARIKEILSLPEASQNLAAACKIAFETAKTAAQAKAELAGGRAGGAASRDDIAARLNRESAPALFGSWTPSPPGASIASASSWDAAIDFVSAEGGFRKNSAGGWERN